jgi:hypothetical protein
MSIMNSLIFRASLIMLATGLLIEASPQDTQRTFPTPQAAAQALVDAAAQNDTANLLRICHTRPRQVEGRTRPR